jgi:hypothetical protein
MTIDDIRQRLIETNRQMRADAMHDHMIERIAKLMEKVDPFDRVLIISAFQASLILELAKGDRKTAITLWQASLHLSAQMLRDMEQKTSPARTH